MEQDIKKSCGALRIGGQAVMEGVMMKGKNKYAVSVRKPDGEIMTALFDSVSVTERHKVLGLPIVRGVVRFTESMVIGIKTLTYSSNFFLEEEETAKVKKETAAGKWWKEHQDACLTAFSVILGTVLALGLFLFLPTLLTQWMHGFLDSNLLVSLLEGLVRVAIFIGYIMVISRMKDIQRVFEYHGAEHKTINCMEDGQRLNPEAVLRYTRLNRRCGTSFLFLVMIISILFFAWINVSNPLLKIFFRLLLVPVVAGVSYEVLIFSSKNDSAFMRIVTWPGLMLQKLTTREPDEQEAETAIASTLAVLAAEGRLPEHLKEDWNRVQSQITLTDGQGNLLSDGVCGNGN